MNNQASSARRCQADNKSELVIVNLRDFIRAGKFATYLCVAIDIALDKDCLGRHRKTLNTLLILQQYHTLQKQKDQLNLCIFQVNNVLKIEKTFRELPKT